MQGDEERVLVVSSPLGEIVDDTIRLHRRAGICDRVVVDQQHRDFFEALKASIAQVMAKLEQIEFAALDEEDEDGGEQRPTKHLLVVGPLNPYTEPL